MSLSWDQYFAQLLGPISSKSKDPSTKVGCIIVGPDHEIRSTGYNSFPRGLNDNEPSRHERPEKYFWIEHAERNAIYNAARCGSTTAGCVMYVSHVPCLDCARGIVQSGIKELVVCQKAVIDEEFQKRWQEHIDRVDSLFSECGVTLRHITTAESNVA